jgi:tetratricopeptide (TPR) repeat protein
MNVVLLSSSLSSVAHSADKATAKMNEATHDLVIEKLERALKSAKSDETISLIPVRARLADLYAERARLKAMTEAEASCLNCNGARADRVMALKLYAIVENEAGKEQKGPLLLQMAQLYKLNSEPQRSLAIYERIIHGGELSHSHVVLAQGYSGRAEYRFGRGEFAQAQVDFETAVKFSPKVRRGPLVHRVAWCQLNRGEQPAAVATLIRILKSPELLTRETTTGPMFDASFQDDVSHDLATFVSRGTVGKREIALVSSLSSKKGQRENLKHLASETERLGNKEAALAAWDAFLSIEGDDQDRLETMVRVARIRFDLGEKAEALKTLETATKLWKSKGCADVAICDGLRGHVRRMVSDWNRAEKKKPTLDLLAAYRAYLSLFEDDIEMTFWAAIVARGTDRSDESVSLYRRSSILAAKADTKSPSTPKNVREILESSLVGEIEMAEALSKEASALASSSTSNSNSNSKSKAKSVAKSDLKSAKNSQPTAIAALVANGFKARESAYEHYLDLNPTGAMAHQVRYQYARLPYEMGNTKEAVDRLETFATSNECRMTRDSAKSGLCIQAADLDLDARVLLKEDAAIEKSANNFSKIYPTRKAEYQRIARTSALKQAEVMSPDDALEKLVLVDLSTVDQPERIKFLKIRLETAEKARNMPALKQSAHELLAVRGLSEGDREFTQSRLAWAYEMSFEFNEAYRITKSLKLKSMRPADRELRLALLAELSGHNPKQHEERFLELSGDLERKALVRAKLIRTSKNPAFEFRRHERELARVPAVLASLGLDVYSRSGDRSMAEAILRNRRVVHEPAAVAIEHHLFFAEFSKVDSRIRNHKVQTGSDYLTQSTLTQHMQLLGQLEAAANSAIAKQDWAEQVVTLSAVSRENTRLASIIGTLPVPHKLKAKQREAYTQALAAKAKVYTDKHQAINEKLDLLWANVGAADELTQILSQTQVQKTQAMLAHDIQIVSAVAPSGVQSKLESALSKIARKPAQEEIVSAIKSVKSKPFNERNLEHLRELESGNGSSETMVAYLDGRLAQLKDGNGK